MLDLGPIVRAQVRQASQHAIHLGRAHLIHAVAQFLESRHHDQAAVPRPESVDLFAHDALRCGNVAAALGGRLGRDRLQVVDVVEEDVFELRDRGLHVPRHAEIEDAERASSPPRNHRGHAVPRDHGVWRGRRREHDIGRREVFPGLVQRERACPPAQPLRNGAGALVRPVRDHADPNALGDETRGRQLGHVAGAEDQRRAPCQLREDPRGNGDRRGRSRCRPGGEAGFAAHARAHEERRLKQPVQYGSSMWLGHLPRVAHLPLNLGFAEDHGIEPR